FPAVLEGYSDADWNTLSDDSNATSGYILSIAGGVVSWKSKKQTILAQSTMESEMIALARGREKEERKARAKRKSLRFKEEDSRIHRSKIYEMNCTFMCICDVLESLGKIELPGLAMSRQMTGWILTLARTRQLLARREGARQPSPCLASYWERF
ncbi:Ty1/copia retrotransposon protein, partial [Trifolium medium]|nr:Ty1/copia retrotransposon protein [Trifolium medium]